MCVCGCVFYVSCRAAKVMRTWIVDGCCVFLRLCVAVEMKYL